MASENTPLSSRKLQGRPVKRFCQSSPPMGNDSLADAIDLLVNDAHLPAHLKTVLGHLLDKAARTEELMSRNRELEAQLRRETEEKSRLAREVETLKEALAKSRQASPVKALATSFPDGNCCEERERVRSVVIAGVSESRDSSAVNRISFDLDCVKRIFDFLSIECMPVTIYRMGKPKNDYARLLKVVLPNSFFQRELLKRAPRLKTFPVSGIYIRRSLPRLERERLSALRKARAKSAAVLDSNATCENAVPSTTSVCPSSSDRLISSEGNTCSGSGNSS